MAKQRTLQYNYKEIPKTLDEHSFFGIELDEMQKLFRDSIWNKNKLIIFCNSAAGTGKTTIATATAELLVKYGLYKGITYITSPVQEQRQGYLKGSLLDKSDPYFAPFYQALTKIGVNINTCMTDDMSNLKNDTGYVTCMTHTFLRGINFEKQVILVDESQNFTVDELQKTLSRIHDNCKVIVMGHIGQTDIMHKGENGFMKYIEHFKGDSRTAICTLKTNYRGWISTWADRIKY